MRVAFVGIKRPFTTIKKDIGIDYETFIRFHIELPFYYSKYGANDVFVTTVDAGPKTIYELDEWEDPKHNIVTSEDGSSMMWVVQESYLASMSTESKPEVVVHWRAWQQWAWDACPDATHLLHTCDHTYGEEWKNNAKTALKNGQLSRIIAFETWHVRQLQQELQVGFENFVTQLHLGVDTEIYHPTEKDPFKLLWASDPGRGLPGCLEVFGELYKKDRRYHLHVLQPDYVKEPLSVSHPGIKVHRNIKNSPELWDMFNTSMFVPYTSTFMEPSSRVHRQGMSAGSVVLYPSDRGSPSELIINGRTGVIIPQSLNKHFWALKINEIRENGQHLSIGTQARMFSLTEDWSVQAERFNRVIKELRR